MGFFEKWYWANYLKGTNPVTAFIGGLIKGFWIPLVAIGIFCLLTGIPYFWFLGKIISTFYHYFFYDIVYFCTHLAEIQKHFRWMLFDN